MKKIIGFLIVLSVLVLSVPLVNATVIAPTTGTSTRACLPSTAPWLKIISPNGGESYLAGSSTTITWTSCNIVGNVIIVLEMPTMFGSPGAQLAPALTGGTPNDGQETVMLPTKTAINTGWTIMQYGQYYKVKITDISHNILDWSDNLFTINKPVISATVIPKTTTSTTSVTTTIPSTTATTSLTASKPFPVGCLSPVGYSSTTGQSCGCNGTVYSTYTGQLCPVSPAPNLPTGCTSPVGYSLTTGQSCGCNGTIYSTYSGQLCPTGTSTTVPTTTPVSKTGTIHTFINQDASGVSLSDSLNFISGFEIGYHYSNLNASPAVITSITFKPNSVGIMPSLNDSFYLTNGANNLIGQAQMQNGTITFPLSPGNIGNSYLSINPAGANNITLYSNSNAKFGFDLVKMTTSTIPCSKVFLPSGINSCS